MEKLIVIIEGPSGVGKDRIILGLIEKYPNIYKKMPSITTRPMRPSENPGDPYYHVTREEFENKIKTGEVFEHTTRHGEYRGMSLDIINSLIARGFTQIKDCDLVGMNALKKEFGDSVFSIFITAPRDVVEARLISRGDSEQDRITRLKDYEDKMSQEKYFDITVQNIGDIDIAVNEVHEHIEKRKKQNEAK